MCGRIKLIPDWKRVLKKAWSIRLILIATILSAIEAALPFITFVSIPPGYLALLVAFITGSAFAARIIAQSNMGNDNEQD